jgi:formylglycine-generating enzyme required for sulfatase activity
VPAGRITLEDKAGRFDVERFLIAKYPVTYRQFLVFVYDPVGFSHKRWWKNLDRPNNPPEQFRRTGNCPADNVSWHDAVAFCRWLSERLRRVITLPTEMEWQQMATGGLSTHEYPWGMSWDMARANTYGSRLDRSTAVGLYPAGATAQGVLDVAGNVWEWCSNRYEEPGAVDYQLTARTLRGGSWGDGRDACRSRGRFSYDPGLRLNLLGFRVRSSA